MATSFDAQHLDSLMQTVDEWLRDNDEGMSEYALLCRLQEDEVEGFATPFADNHQMFVSHFVLYHVLYRLRDELWVQQRGDLEIGALKIRLGPYRQAVGGLARPDPLREYYLDLENLRTTTAGDVEEMLSGFWRRLQNFSERATALQELGLEDPVDDATIKRRYRQLAMQHHPDRGGCQETQQRLNGAMRKLTS